MGFGKEVFGEKADGLLFMRGFALELEFVVGVIETDAFDAGLGSALLDDADACEIEGGLGATKDEAAACVFEFAFKEKVDGAASVCVVVFFDSLALIDRPCRDFQNGVW